MSGFVYCFQHASKAFVKIGMTDTPNARYATLGGDRIFDGRQARCYLVPDNVSKAQVESVVHIACERYRVSIDSACSEGLPDDGLSEWFESIAAETLKKLAQPLLLQSVPWQGKPSSKESSADAGFAELFGGHARWRLLRTLLSLEDGQFCGTRELAQLSGIDPANSSRWLRRWTAAGMLQVDPKTRAVAISPTGVIPILRGLIESSPES